MSSSERRALIAWMRLDWCRELIMRRIYIVRALCPTGRRVTILAKGWGICLRIWPIDVRMSELSSVWNS